MGGPRVMPRSDMVITSPKKSNPIKYLRPPPQSSQPYSQPSCLVLLHCELLLTIIYISILHCHFSDYDFFVFISGSQVTNQWIELTTHTVTAYISCLRSLKSLPFTPCHVWFDNNLPRVEENINISLMLNLQCWHHFMWFFITHAEKITLY